MHLKGLHISWKTIYTQNHLPRPFPLSPPSSHPNITIVLPNPTSWVHCKSVIPCKQKNPSIKNQNFKHPSFQFIKRSKLYNNYKPDVGVAFEARIERGQEVTSEEASFVIGIIGIRGLLFGGLLFLLRLIERL